jgi:hypothetical protein
MFTFFDHQQLRRYLLAFGSFFDSIFCVRYDTTGKETQRIQVPIEYGPKEKWLLHIIQDPDFLQSTAITVPRLSYEMTSLMYDGNRKLNSLNQLRFPNGTEDQSKLRRTYIGVPYLLNINLSALVKFQTDGFQIVEQILPFFTPDLTFVVQNVPELGIADQIPLTLTGVSSTDNYEGDFEKRRMIIWSMDFQMKVYFYGPNKSQGRIEEVIIDVYNAPIASLNEPPEYFTQENDGFIVEEQDTGLLATEATANVYLTTGRAARITAVADPRNQDAEPPDVHAKVTLTDYSGDVKRSRDLTDEEVGQ